MKETLKKDLTSPDVMDLQGPGVSWRHYVDLVSANLEGKLEKAALTIQTGLDKAERTLQTSLADSRRDQQLALSDAEKRVNEKLDNIKTSFEKTEKGLNLRLDQIDATIQRIDRERTLYVTRDQLDLILKSMHAEIKPLARREATITGRDLTIYGFLVLLIMPVFVVLLQYFLKQN